MELIRNVADLDCLLSLAFISLDFGDSACKPEMVDTEEAIFEAHDLKHPCIMQGYFLAFLN